MAKILIVPDIHNRWKKTQQLLKSIEYDQCIFLGDYFDQFGDNPNDVRAVAEWLVNEIVPDERHVLLIGNHDIAYFWSWNQATRCSGYSPEKCKAIMSVLSADVVRARFKFFHVEHGFLFSHAGLSNPMWKEMKHMEEPNTQLLDVLPHWIEMNTTNLETLRPAPLLLQIGWTRGGSTRHGGMLWEDWDTEFVPIKGVNQIVGHTPHVIPEVGVWYGDNVIRKYNASEWLFGESLNPHSSIESINYNLDTHSHHFLIIEDGKVTLWDWDMMVPFEKGLRVERANNAPFIPTKHVMFPEYGVFKITYPDKRVDVLTGEQLCNQTGMYIPNESNTMFIIGNMLKSDHKVEFLFSHLNVNTKKMISGFGDDERFVSDSTILSQ